MKKIILKKLDNILESINNIDNYYLVDDYITDTIDEIAESISDLMDEIEMGDIDV